MAGHHNCPRTFSRIIRARYKFDPARAANPATPELPLWSNGLYLRQDEMTCGRNTTGM